MWDALSFVGGARELMKEVASFISPDYYPSIANIPFVKF